MVNLNNPYFLLLFVLLLLLLVLPKNKFYLRFSWVKLIPKSFNYFGSFKNFLFYLGWIFLTIAAIDPLIGTKASYETQLVHKYVLINDASGSMTESDKEQGMGARLKVLIEGNKAFLNLLDKRSDSSKDLVGALVFSDSSFVVSYIVDDNNFVYKKLSKIDYRLFPLSQGTRVDEGLWGGIDMLVSHSFPEAKNDLDSIRSRMYLEGINYKTNDKMNSIIENFKSKVKGDSLIVFTDGEFMNPMGNGFLMSTYKLLNLCKDLGIKVYAISVERIDPLISKLCRDSGGFTRILNRFNNEVFIKAYEDILNSQPKEFLQNERIIEISYSSLFGLLGLGCLIAWVFLKNTICLNYVEV